MGLGGEKRWNTNTNTDKNTNTNLDTKIHIQIVATFTTTQQSGLISDACPPLQLPF